MLAGSTATGLADEESDYDLYAYTRETVPVEFRARLLKPCCSFRTAQHLWEWSDEWVEPDGTPFDLMYRSCDAIEADVKPSLAEARPRWATQRAFATRLLQATPVIDRGSWFQTLQDQALPITPERMAWPPGNRPRNFPTC